MISTRDMLLAILLAPSAMSTGEYLIALNSVCDRTDYMQLGVSGGMSLTECAERVGSVGTGYCPVFAFEAATSNSSSAECWCFPACGHRRPSTMSVFGLVAFATVASSTTPSSTTQNSSQNLGVTSTAVVSAVSEASVAMGSSPSPGRCSVRGHLMPHMNIGWAGMSRQECFAKAYEVKMRGTECSFVSFSDSPGLARQWNSCQCHAVCDWPLTVIPGEHWESIRVSSAMLGETTGSRAVLIGSVVGCVCFVLAVSLVGLCYCRKRIKTPSVGSRTSMPHVSTAEKDPSHENVIVSV